MDEVAGCADGQRVRGPSATGDWWNGDMEDGSQDSVTGDRLAQD